MHRRERLPPDTSGNNSRCTTALCRTRAGWDGPTGIGSPNGALLAP